MPASGSSGPAPAEEEPNASAESEQQIMSLLMKSAAAPFSKLAVKNRESGPDEEGSGEEESSSRVRKGKGDISYDPRETDICRELERADIPMYDGNYRWLRQYRMQTDLQLSTFLSGPEEYIVPYLTKKASKEL